MKRISTVLFLLILLLSSVACSLTGQTSDEPDTREPVSNTSPTTDASEGAAAEAVEEDAALEAEETGPQVTVTPLEGDVYLRRADEDEFTAILDEVLLTSGDAIRTGSDGLAVLTFANDTEATLFANTQVAIENFSKNASGDLFITLHHFVGNIFSRVNFDSTRSKYEVVTPNGVAAVRGTAFYTDVIYAFMDGLTAEEIAAYINDSAAFTARVLEEFDTTAAGLAPIIISFDIASGSVVTTYIDINGNEVVVSLEPNQVINISDDGAATVTVTDRGCGDGICDPYLGETGGSCSSDC